MHSPSGYLPPLVVLLPVRLDSELLCLQRFDVSGEIVLPAEVPVHWCAQ